jgi:hypothetical protein
MRKVFSVLVLAALTAGMVWAQDEEEAGGLKITGAVKTGFKAEAGKERGAEKDLTFAPWSDDAKKMFRADIQADYTTTNAGVSVRLRADDDILKEANVKYYVFSPLGHAYGWFSFLNNIVEVSGGLLDNAKWGTFTDFNIDNSLDNNQGVKLEIRPVTGLSFGVNLLNIPGRTKAEDAFNGTVIGAKYAIDPFGIAVAFIINDEGKVLFWTNNFAKSLKTPPTNEQIEQQLINTMGQSVWDNLSQDQKDTYIAAAKASSGPSGLSQTDIGILFSGYFYGVPNLKLDLDGTFAAYKKMSAFGIALQGIYNITEPFSVGARVRFGTIGDSDKKTSISELEIRPEAGYIVNNWLGLKLQIPITIAEMQSVDGKTPDNYHSGFGFGLKPKATFTISENAKFVLFYNLDFYDNVYGASKPSDNASVNHTVQFDFVWTF